MNYGVLPWVGNQLDKGYIQNTQKGYSKITLERLSLKEAIFSTIISF